MDKTRMDAPVAIVGMAGLFPRAQGLKQYWRLLRRAEDAVDDVPASHWALDDFFDGDPKAADMTYCRRGAFLSAVPFDPTEFGIPPTALEATDTAQLLALVAARDALHDAGYGSNGDGPTRAFDRARASVILGVTGALELVVPLGARLGHPHWRRALRDAGVDAATADDVVRRISEAYVGWQENSFPGLLGNVVAGRIANRLDLKGTNCVVDAACASSLSAVHLAALELNAGKSDVVLTGGVDAFNDIFMYMCFSKTQALSAAGDARPFSASADGTVVGEGVGIVVLKRLADAERDGDRIYAVLRGMGTSSDGKSQSIYAPRAAGQAEALRAAYASAGVTPDQVQLVEAHGTGTKVGDVVEFEALETVYRESQSNGAWCALGSVKSQIGHTKAAAGAASLIKAALALHARALPPLIKADAPNPKMDLAGSPFYLNTRTRPWFTRGGQPRRAGVSSFGFGGSNFHAVLEEYPAARATDEPNWDGSVQIVALSAESPAGLREQLVRFQTAARDMDFAACGRLADQSRRDFSTDDAHRLVLVIACDEEVSARLTEALARLDGVSDAPAGDDGIHLGRGPAAGKLAMLFPGQGSQYVEMARDLACVFPMAHDAIAAADAQQAGELTRRMYPPPSFDDAQPARDQARLTATEYAQPAIGAASLAWLRVLAYFGVRPDLAAGHSFGELLALRAAGGLTDANVLALARLRGQVLAAEGEPAGAMAAIHAPADALAEYLAQHHPEVVVANHNAPTQCVIAGRADALDRALADCDERGWRGSRLNVSRAFHSPLMRPAQAEFAAALADIEFSQPDCLVSANVTADAYPADPAQMRELLVRQIVEPVRFVDQVRDLAARGARTFLEVGPKRVLTGLVGQILDPNKHRAIAVDASAGRGDGVVDLARALAQLAAAGHPVNLARWEKQEGPVRTPKMVVPLLGINYRAPRESAPPRKQKTAPSQSVRAVQSSNPQPKSDRLVNENQAQPSPRPPAGDPATAPVQAVAAGALTGVYQVVQEGLHAMQALQQQTASAHQRFLEGQEQAQRTFQAVLENQQRMLERLAGLPVTPTTVPAATAPPVAPAAPVPAASATAVPAQPSFSGQPIPAQPVPAHPAPPSSPPPASKPAAVGLANPQAAESQPVAAAPTRDAGMSAQVLLDVVAQLTGYPVEMLDTGMDLEADLGIDSIKRVEILAAAQEKLPQLDAVDSTHLGSLRTLQDIIDHLAGSAPAGSANGGGTPVSQPAQVEPISAPTGAEAGSDLGAALLAIVAELTGYPVEMLDTGMDMEADLGIDSIKRVEILAAVQERLPDMPQVDSTHLGGMRTLADIITHLGGATDAATPAPQEELDPVNPKVGSISPPAVSAPNTPAPVASSALRRQVLTTVALDLDNPTPLSIAPGHEVWVVDDGTALAAALVDGLVAQGIAARVVGSTAPVDGEACAPVGGLIHLFPPADRADASTLDQLRSAFVLTRDLSTDLRAAGEQGGALLVTVSRMDGRFGLTGGDFDPVQGGLAGLAKTAGREWPRVTCRALDLDRAWSDIPAIVAAVLDVLNHAGPVEVGLSAEDCCGLDLIERDVQTGETRLAAGDLVVVTGGARGVTADTVLALAKAHQPVLALLGRSPAPAVEPDWALGLTEPAALKRAIMTHAFAGGKPSPSELEAAYRKLTAAREITANLERIRAIGATVEYCAVDVTDRSAVRDVVRELRARYGPVRGVIHGAGVIEDRRIEDKDSAVFDRVVDTKVLGLQALLDAVSTDDLTLLLLFSSVTGRYGREGQVDYAMANEVLNKMAHRQAARRPHCRVAALNWGPWDGGMVTGPLKREFERLGVELIPRQAGAEALVAELHEADRAAVEVVLGGALPESATHAPAPSNQSRSGTLRRRLAFDTHRFLVGHQIDGRGVLPLAVGLEWMRHVAVGAHPQRRFAGWDDVRVLKGVVLTGESADVTCSAGAVAGDGVEVTVQSSAGGRDVTHFRGRVRWADATGPLADVQVPAGISENPYPHDLARVYREILFHGPPFHALEEITGYGPEGMTARLVVADAPQHWMTHPPDPEWGVDPLLIDGVLQLGILWCVGQQGAPALPAYIASCRVFAAPVAIDTARCVLQVRETSSTRLRADADVVSTEGRRLIQLRGVEWTIDPRLADAFAKGRAASARLASTLGGRKEA
jgi:acyl transferase domain-containing protein